MFPSKDNRPSSQPLLLSRYLDANLVTKLHADERDAAIEELVHLLNQNDKLLDEDAFYQAVLAREAIVSTGIGMGCAIPHAKLAGYTSFFIAIGIHRSGIEWESIDNVPVRLIFLIGGPDDKQTEYLQILSHLTLAIKDEGRRKKMLQMNDGQAMIEIFKGI